MGGGTRRFKRKFKKKTEKKPIENNGERRCYKEIVRENEEFERYYQEQKIVPEEEWPIFLDFLRRDLPTAFRITACSRKEAERLLEIIRSDIFARLLQSEVDLKSLPWYPDSFGWQLTVSRKDIRRNETYFRLHNFLMAETATGNISRQETVSMIPPLLLDVEAHHKVLDLCAAPGSKTAQIIEKLHEKDPVPDGFVVANDVDNSRCYMLVHQSKRLSSPCCIITNHDASNMPNFLTKDDHVVKFDRVLCDVPCSGDGTLRKNADIWTKWNINNANSLHGMQYRILKRGVEMLAVGGRLVYSTCSLNPIEDEAVIQRILHESKGSLELVEVSESVQGLKYRKGLKTWKPTSKDQERIMEKIGIDSLVDYNIERCIRILPHDNDTGGFFVGVIVKKSTLPWEAQVKNDPETAEEKPKYQKEKRRRILGYREDPFVFFNGEEPVWESIEKFYQIENLDPTCLLTRCHVGKKKNIYFTSKSVKELVDHNQTRIKIINTGVKVFARSDNKSMQCDFRLVHEGLYRIKEFIKGRCVVVPDEDIVKLLQNFDPHNPVELTVLSETTRKNVEGISQGSCVINSPGEMELSFVGWRGTKSLRVYISKPEAIHYLRLFGVDVSIYDVNKFQKEEVKDEEITKDDQDNEEILKDDQDNEEILKDGQDIEEK